QYLACQQGMRPMIEQKTFMLLGSCAPAYGARPFEDSDVAPGTRQIDGCRKPGNAAANDCYVHSINAIAIIHYIPPEKLLSRRCFRGFCFAVMLGTAATKSGEGRHSVMMPFYHL